MSSKGSVEMTYENYERILEMALDAHLVFLTHTAYLLKEECGVLPDKVFVMRHDIDLDRDVEKSVELARIEAARGVYATYFVRVHDPEYNVFDYRSYLNIQRIIELGHEIGLHSEALDFASAVEEPPEFVLEKEIAVLEVLFGIKINGAACHGDISQHNNLDFWHKRSPQDFGLLYEVYHRAFGFFWASKYISNHQGNNWKCYLGGELVENDYRSIWAHLEDDKDQEELFYNVLVHPRPWHKVHWRVC